MKDVLIYVYLVDCTSNICLSQRLSYAYLDVHSWYSVTVDSLLNHLWPLWLPSYCNWITTSYANHCFHLMFIFKLCFVSPCCHMSFSMLLATLLISWLISKIVVSLFKKKHKNIYLAALGLSCSMQDLLVVASGIYFSNQGLNPDPSALRAWSLSHWATWEVPIRLTALCKT